MNKGFLYLVAIIDWYSRYILSWELSNTLDADFCLQALDKALLISQPEIFNSDQGSQSRSSDFTEKLEKVGIKISRDSRGRVFDNIFIERLWRTVKYEEVYIHSYDTVKEARESLDNYFRFYNSERLCSAPHKSRHILPSKSIEVKSSLSFEFIVLFLKL